MRNFDRGERDHDHDRTSMYHFGSANNRSTSANRSYHRFDHNDHYAPGTPPPPLRQSSDVYRREYDRRLPSPPRGFTFRHDAPPTISAAKDAMYRSETQHPRRSNDNRQNDNGYGQGRRGRNQSEGRGGYRGYHGPRMASDRAFLRGNREPTPELMPGMEEDEAGVRFKRMEDMSDSDEADMDMSDDENAKSEQPNKKARTIGKVTDGDSVPRWSNPDPYTALPPPDESQRKKKDVVKLIRKARVEANSLTAAKVDPAEDFISFDFSGEKEDTHDPPPNESKSGIGVVGAPTGPRFSHNANLHKQPPSVPAATVSTRVLNEQDLAQATLSNHTEQARADRNGQLVINGTPRLNSDASEPDLRLAKVSRISKPVNLDTISDPALGSRKRNNLDEIKPAPVLHRSGKGVSRQKVDGEILKEWRPKASVPSTPWLEIDHSDTASMGLW